MKHLLVVFTALSLLIATYQQCSVSSDSGIGNMGSSGPPGTLPTLNLDLATINLSTTASSFSVSGDCNVGPYTNYSFDFSYQETGASSSSTRSYNSTCNAERFNVAVQLSQLSIRPNFPGNLTVRIKATRTSGDVEGPAKSVRIAWGGTPTPTPTPTPPPAPAPPPPPPCSPSCDANRSCGSTLDSCGTHTCAAQTASPPCAPPAGSGCVTLQQNMVCVDCGNYGQTITSNQEDCRVHCGSRSKCCEWNSDTGACTYFLHNVPASCRVESRSEPVIWSGRCY